jgi:hypothetical protein
MTSQLIKMLYSALENIETAGPEGYYNFLQILSILF